MTAQIDDVMLRHLGCKGVRVEKFIDTGVWPKLKNS